MIPSSIHSLPIRWAEPDCSNLRGSNAACTDEYEGAWRLVTFGCAHAAVSRCRNSTGSQSSLAPFIDRQGAQTEIAGSMFLAVQSGPTGEYASACQLVTPRPGRLARDLTACRCAVISGSHRPRQKVREFLIVVGRRASNEAALSALPNP